MFRIPGEALLASVLGMCNSTLVRLVIPQGLKPSLQPPQHSTSLSAKAFTMTVEFRIHVHKSTKADFQVALKGDHFVAPPTRLASLTSIHVNVRRL